MQRMNSDAVVLCAVKNVVPDDKTTSDPAGTSVRGADGLYESVKLVPSATFSGSVADAGTCATNPIRVFCPSATSDLAHCCDVFVYWVKVVVTDDTVAGVGKYG